MRLPPGHRIDRYSVVAFLGAGAMGEVYEATDTKLERSVALKVLRPEMLLTASVADASSSARRLLREAKAVAALEHPNIVAVFDVGEIMTPGASEPITFLAMELVRGTTLRTFVGGDTATHAQKVRWLVEVARALAAAHRAGLIHRDIKPDNVMIREDGVVKVLDFGIAKRAPAAFDANAATAVPDTLTREGSIVGTPYYMAPEQMRGRTIDGRADQFAWGVMAYELLSGARPWSEGDAVQLIAEVLTHAPPALDARDPAVPHDVARTVMRALEKLPEQRFASMDELIDALEGKSFEHAPTAPKILVQGTAGSAPISTPMMSTGSSLAATRRSLPGEEPAAPPKRSKWIAAALIAAAGAALAAKALLHDHAASSAPGPSASSLGAAASSVSQPASAGFPDYGSTMSKAPGALEAYRSALSLLRDATADRASRELDRALALDPSFAAAHLRRALAAKMPPADADREHLQEATRMRASLGEHDQILVDALAPLSSTPGDLTESGKRLEAAVAKFPHDADLLLQLCRVQAALGDYSRATGTCARASEADPGAAAPLYARAMTQMHDGDATAGLASLDGCLRVSPLATDCLLRLAQFHALAGECTDALTTARRYVSADRSNASSYEVLAEVLMAAGEPLESVTTALSDELDRTPAPLAKLTRIQNQTYLSIATGSFVAADAALDAWDEVIASSRDEDDHFEPTIVHIELALEEGRKNKARALAEAYLAHRPAWAMSDSNDGSMFCIATLHRVGAITDGDFAARRQAWLDRKKALPRGSDYGASPAFAWIAAFAAPARSPDEAREALDALPSYLPLPDPMMRAPEFEEPIGNVYRLAGRNADAIPFLTLAAKSCVGLGSSFAPTWARLELGEALEATGDQAGACEAYRVVVKRWGAAPTSLSARQAAARLRALACPK